MKYAEPAWLSGSASRSRYIVLTMVLVSIGLVISASFESTST